MYKVMQQEISVLDKNQTKCMQLHEIIEVDMHSHKKENPHDLATLYCSAMWSILCLQNGLKITFI